MVADALVLATEWGGSFDWRVIRNMRHGTLVIGGLPALDGALVFTIGFAYVDIGRISALFAHGNNFLDLPGTVEAHTVAN
jgi:hypothetical protein